MNTDAAIIPINSFSPAAAVQALAEQHGRHNLTTLHNLSVEDLDDLPRRTYLEAQRLGVVQFLVSFVRQYGEPAQPQSHVWQVNRAKPPISIRIEVRRDATIEAWVTLLGVTPEREILTLSDFSPSNLRMIEGRWLTAVAEEYEAAEQRRQHAERLADRVDRDARISDLTASI